LRLVAKAGKTSCPDLLRKQAHATVETTFAGVEQIDAPGRHSDVR
jgi:hypothetical protein